MMLCDGGGGKRGKAAGDDLIYLRVHARLHF